VVTSVVANGFPGSWKPVVARFQYFGIERWWLSPENQTEEKSDPQPAAGDDRGIPGCAAPDGGQEGTLHKQSDGGEVER